MFGPCVGPYSGDSNWRDFIIHFIFFNLNKGAETSCVSRCGSPLFLLDGCPQAVRAFLWLDAAACCGSRRCFCLMYVRTLPTSTRIVPSFGKGGDKWKPFQTNLATCGHSFNFFMLKAAERRAPCMRLIFNALRGVPFGLPKQVVSAAETGRIRVQYGPFHGEIWRMPKIKVPDSVLGCISASMGGMRAWCEGQASGGLMTDLGLTLKHTFSRHILL